MRILQLIDSLATGGAEMMAVNYAIALSTRIDSSYLCAGRKEGSLKEKISSEVGYLFLDRKSVVDIAAVLRLYRFLKKENIDIIHAHGSSYFLATLVKFLIPSIGLIFHFHHGNIAAQKKFKLYVLKFCSTFCGAIFCVSKDIHNWAVDNLNSSGIFVIRNFIFQNGDSKLLELPGTEGKRLVHLANWRYPKDHLTLIKAFDLASKKTDGLTLHLIGKVFNDDYAKYVKLKIADSPYKNLIFIHGEQEQPQDFLTVCDVGLLTSQYEGLPVAILEYGLAGLPVVATAVGEIPHLLENRGICVPANDAEVLAGAVLNLLNDKCLSKQYGNNFKIYIENNYLADKILPEVIAIYDDILRR
ncbi:glycosyltransferase [Leeuwenhoekiella sp. A2]|uniref:glycosyltransferase n=1 Tax=Leeuwenhoekiella sp. A2 TaxID=3141460 RepID=UPI003A809872